MAIAEKFQLLADGIRGITGESAKMTPAQMIDELGSIQDEVETQTDLIDQILAALESKTSGGGAVT